MFPMLAIAAPQISALVFISILIIAGAVVMGLTTNDILSSGYDRGGADTLYNGVVVILLIGVIGAVVTALFH